MVTRYPYQIGAEGGGGHWEEIYALGLPSPATSSFPNEHSIIRPFTGRLSVYVVRDQTRRLSAEGLPHANGLVLFGWPSKKSKSLGLAVLRSASLNVRLRSNQPHLRHWTLWRQLCGWHKNNGYMYYIVLVNMSSSLPCSLGANAGRLEPFKSFAWVSTSSTLPSATLHWRKVARQHDRVSPQFDVH